MNKVSLILTSFNCKVNIKRTLDSIEAQDYPDIEVIIIDGGSTDGTVDCVKQYAEETRFQCKWISEKDNGLYDAMNKGYKLSSGDIIAFFNDLFLAEDVVSLVVKTIEEKGVDGAHGDLIYATDESVRRYWKMGEGRIRRGWMPGHPTLYLKRKIYEEYGVYDASYKCSADYEFMVRILKDEKVKLAYIPQTLVRMYYGGTSTESLNSYILSLREAHRGLVQNHIKGAYWIDFLRTIKVLMQFARARSYQQNRS